MEFYQEMICKGKLLNIIFLERLFMIIFTILFYNPNKSINSNKSRPSSVYGHLLCILTSFRVLRQPKSWSKHFLGAVFNLISAVKSLKMFELKEKVWKQPPKSVLTSFWVSTAPESWSKYTTDILEAGPN